jgi:hypothetical protein
MQNRTFDPTWQSHMWTLISVMSACMLSYGLFVIPAADRICSRQLCVPDTCGTGLSARLLYPCTAVCAPCAVDSLAPPAFYAQVCKPDFFIRTLQFMQDDDASICLTPQHFHNYDPKGMGMCPFLVVPTVPAIITEICRIHLVLFGMKSRTFGPHWQPYTGNLLHVNHLALCTAGMLSYTLSLTHPLTCHHRLHTQLTSSTTSQQSTGTSSCRDKMAGTLCAARGLTFCCGHAPPLPWVGFQHSQVSAAACIKGRTEILAQLFCLVSFCICPIGRLACQTLH